jgi:hypothetical protein
LVHSYRKFDQFQELPSTGQRSFFLWKNAGASANLPVASSNFFENAQYEKVANPASGWYQRQYSQCAPQQGMHQYNPWQAKPLASASFAPYSRVFKQKETLWEEFKRIYINEVIAFTMSKSTLFTLIFSFMFLGCIFFLGGFFTATNIYREQHITKEVNRQHTPTETAMLQGRPEKIVNMGAGVAFSTPKAYQYQGGVKVDQNRRRPSEYVEKQIASSQPNYR